MQIVANNHMQAQLRLQYIECEVLSVYDIRLAGPGSSAAGETRGVSPAIVTPARRNLRIS